MRAPTWTIIIPVKRLQAGKSRLRAARPTGDDLVLAIAIDTIESVLGAEAVHRVLVVTDDRAVVAAATSLGAETLGDPGGGLNAAIAHGAASAGHAGPLAALLADLPALRPVELTEALNAAMSADRRAYLQDHQGTGTTLLAAPPAVPLDPHFGPGSAAAHAASGALALHGAWPGLRLDVDTHDDLAAASALGLGPRTTDALARHP